MQYKVDFIQYEPAAKRYFILFNLAMQFSVSF